MRPSLPLLVMVCASLPAALVSTADAKPRLFSTTDAGVVYATSFVLDAGGTYQMWSRGTSAGGDPVMHLKAQQPDTTWAYEASNDDWQVGSCASAPSGGMVASDACIEYTNNTGAAQAATLLVHAYRRPGAGTTLLTVRRVGGATLVSQGIAFAGDAIQSVGGDPVEWNAFERLDYAYSLTGIVFPRVIALRSSEEPIRSATKNMNGSIYAGLWGQPRVVLPVASAGAPGAGKGGPMFVVGSIYATKGYGDGSARMYLNDIYFDTDGDGLGDSLEATLGTCSAPGQGCDRPADSDDDGFYDALEVIGGAHHPDCAQLDPTQGPTDYDAGLGCSINLGTYGADPLERDIFVQLNWMKTATGGDPFVAKGIDIGAAAATIQDRFSSAKTLFGVDKPEFQLHVDYGQWQHFGLGGGDIDYQYRWCHHAEGTGQCDDFETLYPQCPTGSAEGDTCQGCGGADCVCKDVDYNGAGNRGRCTPRQLDDHCDSVCDRYDAGHLAPDGSDPHAPSNSNASWWGQQPVFPVNRRGLFLPAVFVEKIGEDHGAGVCTALSCGGFGGENPILPGIVVISQGSAIDTMDTARVLMHELGHQLSLRHAPDTSVKNDQPNHVSVMNYSFSGNGVVPDGRPDYDGERLGLVAASGLLSGVLEEDCDPAVPTNCPQALAQDGSCTVGWFDGACYSGGLDERLGVGDNKLEDGSDSEVNHAYVLSQLACAGPPSYDDDIATLNRFAYNVDWNGNGETPYDPAEQEPYSNPGENLSFALLYDEDCAADNGWDGPLATLDTLDEWKKICDELPASRQGRGIPEFCDGSSFGCTSPAHSCTCGWCMPAGTSPPSSCITGGTPGEPTCDDDLP